MDIKEIKENARKRMKNFCLICPECNGIWCAGKVPGMGGAGTGESFKRSFKKLKEIKLTMRTLHNISNPNMETTIFNQKLSFPAMVAPITGTKFNMGGYINDEQYSNDVVFGAIEAGTIAMIGDTGDPKCFELGLDAIKKQMEWVSLL